MGGHLPAKKVTPEIAQIRGFEENKDIISPPHFKNMKTKNDLKEKVDYLREASEGRPIGVKMAAGNIEKDMEFALFANPDFITIDGRAGGTGAAPKFVKAATSIPTIFALYRARKFLNDNKINGISLIITGNFRISPDFTKAIAMGADAVAIATSALIAMGCEQYRICHTGKCPMGITTQDPELRKRFNVEKASKGLENFINVSTEEMKDFARITGNMDIHDLSTDDLCTTNSEISSHTNISHV